MEYFDARQYIENLPATLFIVSVKSGKIVYSNKEAEKRGFFAGAGFFEMLADKNDFQLLTEAGLKPVDMAVDLKLNGEPYRANMSVCAARFSGIQSLMVSILYINKSKVKAAEIIVPVICDIFTSSNTPKKEREFLKNTAESFGSFSASLYEQREGRFKLIEEWREKKSVVIPILCPDFEDKCDNEIQRIKRLKRASDAFYVKYRKVYGTEGIIIYCFERESDESAAKNAKKYAEVYAALSPDEPKNKYMLKVEKGLSSLNHAFAAWNRETREIIYDNSAFRELFGYICERRMTKIIGANIYSGKNLREEYSAPDGRNYEVAHSLSRIHGEYIVTTLFYDVTKYKKAETKLDAMANIDALTGLLNRRAGTEKLETVYKKCRKEKTPLTVCFADIDGLKSINDTYGHGAGDIMIRSVADVLKKYINGSGFSCRLGGDEFVIILPEIDREQALLITAQIEREARKCLIGDSQGISMSFGFKEADFCADETAETLVSVADSDMYIEKRKRHSK